MSIKLQSTVPLYYDWEYIIAKSSDLIQAFLMWFTN